MGTHLNCLGEAVLTSNHNLCLSRNMKNISFLSENFQFWEVKFSIYLNRDVFLMHILFYFIAADADSCVSPYFSIGQFLFLFSF